MKKVISLLIILAQTSLYSALAIEDEFVDSTLDKNLKIEKPQIVPIVDDFANSTLNNTLRVTKLEYIPVNDFMTKNLDSTLKIQPAKRVVITQTLDRTVIKISPLKYYSTRKNLFEGDYIDFVVDEDVHFNDIVIKKNTPVKARVETVSPNEASGVPADLIVDNFVIGGNIEALGQISKKGASRSLWVRPCALLLTPFFGIGLFMLAIRGGHVKLKPSSTYEVYLEGSQNL